MPRRAFLIGANTQGLQYADRDLDLMESAFATNSYEVHRGSGGHFQVHEHLYRFCAQSLQTDTIIVYFTGHAYLRRGHLFLQLLDSTLPDENAYLPLSSVTAALESSVAANKLVILDCCNALAAMREWQPTDSEAYRLLAASRVLERAKEIESFRASFLTHFLHQALIEKPTAVVGRTGAIHINALYEWIRRAAPATASTLDIAIPTPALMGNQGADFVVADAPPPVIKLPSSYTPMVEYVTAFLECTNRCPQACDGSRNWCRPFSENILGRASYVVPRVKIPESDGFAYPQLSTYLDSWYDETDRPHLTILGDSGVGKTSACMFVFRTLAKLFLQAPDTALAPLFIPLEMLGEFSGQFSIRRAVRDFLNIPLDDAAVTSILEAGRFVIILDGFDEMSDAASLSRIIRIFGRLRPFFPANVRTLLTCRTQYFASSEQVDHILRGELRGTDLFREVHLNNPRGRIIELQEFSEDEILDIIRARLPNVDVDATWKQITDIYELRDLCRRGILLKLVLETYPTLTGRSRPGEKLRSWELYAVYVERWFHREAARAEYTAEVQLKRVFIEELSLQMWAQKTSAIKHSMLTSEVRDYYRNLIFSLGDLEHFEYDTRNASFLTRDASSNYRFIHKSFLEYFVAARCLREIIEMSPELKAWRVRWFSKEIANFVSEAIDVQPSIAMPNLSGALRVNEDPLILWNVLHTLSLVDERTFSDHAGDFDRQDLVRQAWGESRTVMIRQYCRIVARFVSEAEARELIRRVVEIVRSDPAENQETTRTYIEYYGGRIAAAEALMTHLSTMSTKYDRRLHIHVLGEIGSTLHAGRLTELITSWTDQAELVEARTAIDQMISRAE